MRWFTMVTTCLTAGLVCVALRRDTAAQEGSGSSRSSPPRATRPMTPDEFCQAFWKHLTRPESSYKKWEAPPGRGGLRAGGAPHGEFVRTYANKTATGDMKKLPYGAILVAESYEKNQKTLTGVAVMYRSKGADPEHGDWYWLNYLPDGTIARTPDNEGKKPIAGKVASCIACHARAGEKDFVYSNDPQPQADEK